MSWPDPAKVRYLREFYSAAEIREFWRQLGDTDRNFAVDPVAITSDSQDGATTSGITVRTAADAAIWMASAEQAYLEQKAEEDDAPAPAPLPGTVTPGTDWSQRMVRA